jgi:hypothetical protein
MWFTGFHFLIMKLPFDLQIHTLCIGAAAGHACLVLAAGKKGKRYMFPHAKGINMPGVLSFLDCFLFMMKRFYHASYDSATSYPFIWNDASI